jgi:hypothetical protein
VFGVLQVGALFHSYQERGMAPQMDKQMSSLHRPVRVAAITTVRHNVGDDFVREGIFYLLRKCIPSMTVQLIHKHLPITVRPEWDWFYRAGVSNRIDKVPRISALGVSSRIDRMLPLNSRSDRILNCDVLVQCGAPIYWLHGRNGCEKNEWFDPLIRRRWDQVRDRVPFLNVGGGTCQEYASDGMEFEAAGATLAYIRELHDDCILTTVRDELSIQVAKLAGRSVELLPCPSIFARFALGVPSGAARYVALNYMPAAGHYALRGIDLSVAWEKTFVAFVKNLPKNETYKFICHNLREKNAARKLFPQHEILWSEDYRDYLRFYSEAKYGVLNRVHAAFALASFGRPSVVVGNDSRARMCSMIGVRHMYVENTTEGDLHAALEQLPVSIFGFEENMRGIQANAEATYLRLLRGALMLLSGTGV